MTQAETITPGLILGERLGPFPGRIDSNLVRAYAVATKDPNPGPRAGTAVPPVAIVTRDRIRARPKTESRWAPRSLLECHPNKWFGLMRPPSGSERGTNSPAQDVVVGRPGLNPGTLGLKAGSRPLQDYLLSVEGRSTESSPSGVEEDGIEHGQGFGHRRNPWLAVA